MAQVEKLLPPDRGKATGALREAARGKFLQAMAHECPHVLASLRDDLLPKFRVKESVDSALVSEWQKRFNLQGCYWIREAAVGTLAIWSTFPETLTDGPFRFYPDSSAAAVECVFGEPPQQLSRHSLDSELVPVIVRSADDIRRLMRAGMFPIAPKGKRTIIGRRTFFRFDFPAFEPYLETRPDWETRCREEFESRLRDHLESRSAPGEAARKGKKPGMPSRHFSWAALYVAGQTGRKGAAFGMAAEEIRSRVRMDSRSAVDSGIRHVLELVAPRLLKNRHPATGR
jgi:hypothetical protein